MRIVSGKYKGRAINPPRNLRARPTTDFAKENLFNVLGNLVDFEQCDVLDLFAGTGSISYEFASRGARSVTSVEINPVHYNFIRQTAAQLGIGNLYPRQIGAVNVIKFTKGLFGKLKLKGYNSDIIGFKQSIDPLLKETHRKALILGTGGASKAVFHGLKQLGVGATLVSRKPKEFCITYDEITPKTMEQYTVIVNTTPLGMFPNIDSCPDIPYDLLTPNHLLYDLLYNPDETLFMKKGKEKGAVVKNGLEMLLLQAFAAWEIWQK